MNFSEKELRYLAGRAMPLHERWRGGPRRMHGNKSASCI